jgi:hypothetical protein
MSIRRVLAVVVLAVMSACASSAQQTPKEAPPAAATATCPPDVITPLRQNGAGCLDPSVLGAATVDACGAELTGNGWQDDPIATGAISERLGKPVRCWHAPAAAAL